MSRLKLEFSYGLGGVADGWDEQHHLKLGVFDAATSAQCRSELDAVADDEEASSEVVRKFLKQAFVSGLVLVDGETVPAEADDIDGFPNPILFQLMERCSRSRFASPKVGMN